MGADEGPRDVWSDLVGGLLDARSDPATARFDDELAAAVTSGAVTAEAAHRLRFWQRASVRALADHARHVVPVALGALDAARLDAQQYVAGAADVLGAPEAAAEPHADDTAHEAGAPSGGEPAAQEPAAQRPAAQVPAAQVPAKEEPPQTPDRRASTGAAPEPSTLETPSRLIVADLTVAEPRTT